jgi:ABC-type enterobactin transport system permease subunit
VTGAVAVLLARPVFVETRMDRLVLVGIKSVGEASVGATFQLVTGELHVAMLAEDWVDGIQIY